MDENTELVASRILELCKQNATGCTDALLQKEMRDVDKLVRVAIINDLLAKDLLKLGRQGSVPVFLANDSEQAEGENEEEKVVYRIIRAAGNKGIWVKDVRVKSNLSQTVVSKILKSMEGRKLIKAVNSVAASKKKVYMLYNLVPDLSVTGGAWYSNEQDFESELVEVLRKFTQRFLVSKAEEAKTKFNRATERRKASWTSAQEVLDFIKESGILKVMIGMTEIENILQTLVLDDLVEKDLVDDRYRATEPMYKSPGLLTVPCGVCPVINDCCVEGGEISPVTCIYLEEW